MASTDPVVVLGGGFAGLSCATALAEAGRRVVVLEKKPRLGGRACSFVDPRTGKVVDNGQHLFMGCYRQTRAFLRRVGSEALVRFPAGARVDYAEPGGRRDRLDCPGFLPAPLHLAAGVARLSGLSWREKLGLKALRGYFSGRLEGPLPAELDGLTVRRWLTELGQSERAQTRLFDPIAIGALNEQPERASALGFAQVLREIFFRDAESSRLGLATVGLSELYAGQSRAFIEARGGSVRLSEAAAAVEEDGVAVRAVRTERGERLAASAVVSTLPAAALAKLERPAGVGGTWETLPQAPIVGINLWLDRPVLDEPFVGLLGTELHWAFNKTALWGETPARHMGTGAAAADGAADGASGGQYLSLVISGAHRQIGLSPKELVALAERDLAACFPAFKRATITAWAVVKEPFATLSPVPGSDAARPGHKTAVRGLFLAGDWTQTGLPATIESAVAGGHAAARLALGETR